MSRPKRQDVLLVGLSGVSSSGKTTVARLLRGIFENSFIIHEDDFYWSDQQIPVKNGVQDWDCIEAIDLEKLQNALLYIRKHGEPPPELESKEDQNSVGDTGVSDEDLAPLKKEAERLLEDNSSLRIALIDGFLLYSESMKEIRRLLDVKLFLTTDYQTAKSRREARTGYVTLEGFWEDPPGYVEDVVWPNYVKEHSFLFVNGNVEGILDDDKCREVGIQGLPSVAHSNMKTCVEWAFERIKERLQ